MAKIYESLMSKRILQEKRWDSFDSQRVNLLGEDAICMVFPGNIASDSCFFFIT